MFAPRGFEPRNDVSIQCPAFGVCVSLCPSNGVGGVCVNACGNFVWFNVGVAIKIANSSSVSALKV